MILVRYIPSWFPFAGFKRSALKWRQDYDTMREVPFEYAVRNMVRLYSSYLTAFCVFLISPYRRP